MKNLAKICFVVIALFIGVNVNAQGISYGVKAGVNMSNFGGDMDDADPKIGFSIGATLDYGFTNNLYLLTGLDFTTKGAKGDIASRGKITANPMYLQVPVHFGYKLDITDNSRLVVSAGPYAAYGIGGKYKLTVGDTSISTDFFGDEEDGVFKRFDFGVGLSVGYEFDRFKAAIGYDFGLVNISYGNNDVKTQNAFLTFGYRF